MNTNSTQKRAMPIRFYKLRDGSDFIIFAEPSRDIRKSNDKTIYRKVADSHSIAVDDESKAIILYPEDLVIPLTRGSSNGSL
jgi:hypothetical protein